MPNELLIDENEIDVTAANLSRKSIQTTEPSESVEQNHLLAPAEQKSINYLSFGRYKVGLVEDGNRRVLGIYSIEVVRDFYEIGQLEGRKTYWDPEDYYD